MRPSIFLLQIIAPALVIWFGQALPSQADQSSADSFPVSIEVIPGKLRVKIFSHEVQYQNEKIPCWTYLTDGLASHHQKEISFTLRRNRQQKPEDYPRGFLDLFATIFDYAERGSLVDVGDETLFGETGFLGRKDFRGIGYVEPQGFPGVETGGVAFLAGILLKNDEAQIAWNLGLTRITALLGMKYRFYPVPTWSDLDRDPVMSLRDMQGSVLEKVAKIGVRATYYEEQNRILLSLFPSSKARIGGFLSKLSSSTPIALLTQPDLRANACLVWTRGGKHPVAITPEGSDGSRKSGAFLAFVPEQKATEIRQFEDGFYVFVTNQDWQKVRDSLLSGSDAFIHTVGAGEASLTINWAKPEGYTSPVTGETTMADRWVTYEPNGTVEKSKTVAISSSRIVLLTSDADLQARVTVTELADYINAIKAKVDAFFAPEEQHAHRKLTIHFDLSSLQTLRMVTTPELKPESAENLHKELQSVLAPKVRGPIAFEYYITVW